jgi:hypothetical protein
MTPAVDTGRPQRERSETKNLKMLVTAFFKMSQRLPMMFDASVGEWRIAYNMKMTTSHRMIFLTGGMDTGPLLDVGPAAQCGAQVTSQFVGCDGCDG